MSLFKTSVLVCLSILVTACAIDPQKSPCDYYGQYCGKKIKINQW